MIFFFQDAVVNRTTSFSQPKALTVEAAQALDAPDVEPVELTTPDGARLNGWLVRNTTKANSPLSRFLPS